MKKLPLGVYAVCESYTEGTVTVTFRQEDYEAVVGENAFPGLEMLVHQDLVPAEAPFCGYCGVPVVIVPAGKLTVGHNDSTKEAKFRTYFPKAVALLGENVGISPNGADLRAAAPRAEESVLEGSYYFGTLAMGGEIPGIFTVDGITLRTKIYDERTGGEHAALEVKNCIIDSQLSYNLIYAGPDFAGDRSVTVSDCRADGLPSMQGEGNLICVRSGRLTVERLYVANTDKFLGMSNYAYTVTNGVRSVLIRDSIFENSESTHGLTFHLPEDTKAMLRVENCEFIRFVPENEPVITAILPSYSVLQVINTRFVGKSDGPAVLIDGNTSGFTFNGSTQEGFAKLSGPKPKRRTAVDPETVYPVEDPHEAVEADFAPLDAVYEGTQLFYGDFHCHSNSGGTSDGRTPLAEYVPAMKELKMDFAAIVDHKQMRHYFLPEWDEDYLICGMEPGTTLIIPERPIDACKLHYTMIFPDKTGLAQVFGAFPEFQFSGTWQGSCKYPRFTMERFRELAEYIYNIGGVLSHAHPKQMMVSRDPMDYYISDLVPLETVHVNPASFATRQNRDVWVGVLQQGKRVRTHGSTDAHGPVSNKGLTAVYAPRHFSTDIFNAVRAGNCTAGSVGIQMAIDDTPMGSDTDFAEGRILRIRTDRFHEAHLQEDTVYCLKVYTDRGLAYAREFAGEPQSLALKVEDRGFYRVEITNESDHALVALSNPIWLNRIH